MKKLGLLAMVVGVALLTAPPAAQTTYPNRPLRLIIPFGAGGIGDTTARLVAEKLGEKLGQRIVVENQPGAGGVVAARAVLSAPADGYTLALLTNGTAISAALFKTLPFDPVKDFRPVSSFAYFDFIFAANAGSPYKNLNDFAAAARAKPGALNMGTINVGSSQNLTAQLFKLTAQANFTIVPYRTSPEVLIAILRNDVGVMVEAFVALRSPLSEGKLRALATTGVARSPLMADVPTVRESGFDFEVVSWNGMFAPAGTSPEIIATLNKALQEVLSAADVKQRFLALGIEAKASSPEEIGARLRADIEKWSAVIERAGIPKQ